MNTTMHTHWQKNLAFSSEIGGHQVITDAPLEFDGENRGPSPKKLMMVALSGCTGIDVISLLKKMRVELASLTITVEAELTDGQPSLFSSMHLIYSFRGENLERHKLEKAVTLSQDKYCGVSAMYRKIMEVSWEIRINEQS
ncbi:MAG: osmotically inducible protein C [Desulfobulbus propionicus]|nr:MAG: osmotically inducible protein C [Desulfobulbus propionicus]